MSRDIDNPIFMVGMPRSGTTMTFQMLAAHEDLGWFSQVNDRFPRFPATSALSRLTDLNPTFRKANVRSNQRRRLVERLRLGPAEAYDLWEHMVGEQFLHEFLIGVEASPGERHRVRETVDQVLRYQGKPRFAAKTTGPARIGYLNSIFPHAHFIHLVRDGRAAVRSLLNVGFWRDTWRMNEPAWRGGMSEDRLSRWREEGQTPRS